MCSAPYRADSVLSFSRSTTGNAKNLVPYRLRISKQPHEATRDSMLQKGISNAANTRIIPVTISALTSALAKTIILSGYATSIPNAANTNDNGCRFVATNIPIVVENNKRFTKGRKSFFLPKAVAAKQTNVNWCTKRNSDSNYYYGRKQQYRNAHKAIPYGNR